ncbi:unnamed protein product, partial [Prunus brigantina]
ARLYWYCCFCLFKCLFCLVEGGFNAVSPALCNTLAIMRWIFFGASLFFLLFFGLFRRALVKIFGHSFDILSMSVYNLAPPFDLMQCVCSCILTCLLLESHFVRA